jgi:uncharacterized protein (TIGR02466 family)
MTSRQIFPLFSTPVYVNNLAGLAKPDVRFLEYTNRTPAGQSFGFLSSVDKNVLDRPGFESLRQQIQAEVDFYAHHLFAVTRKAEFYLTNSWVNIYGRGDQAGAHIHHNSLLSGVLYLQASDAGGEIVFHRESQSQIPFPSAIDPEVETQNLYNCRSWGYQPKTNDICIFPSILSHSVQPNASDEARWSLAFNVYVRGEFGAIHRLHLK